MTDKLCRTCGDTKSLTDFWKSQSACIPCTKHKQKTRWGSRTPLRRLEQHLKYKYGISHDEFMKAWHAQQGCCAICQVDLPDLMVYENRRRGYAIDHNHETGDFRGILCLKCNSLLGMACDSVNVLQAAIEYLQDRGSYAELDGSPPARKKGK